MPNFGLFATQTDLLLLLDRVFEETDCRAYESFPPQDHPVREFRSAAALAAALAESGVPGREGEEPAYLHLKLWSPAMRAAPRITRHEGTNRLRQPTFRELCEGWGLLTLVGEGYSANLAWNSEARARRMGLGSYLDKLGHPDEWDWTGVEATVREVKRIARGLAVRRVRSSPVLPGAAELLDRQLRPPAADVG